MNPVPPVSSEREVLASELRAFGERMIVEGKEVWTYPPSEPAIQVLWNAAFRLGCMHEFMSSFDVDCDVVSEAIEGMEA